jgi:photosystem II stability/assembly factor-like uncharacterized protein
LLLFSSPSDNGIWYFQESGVTNDLFGVCFLDTLTGWVCGDSGLILNTINGGQIWNRQLTPTSRKLNDIFFYDTRNGWAVGDSGTILHTQNGGSYWEIQNSPLTEILQSVLFKSETIGYCCGNSNTIIYTSDGGQHWTGFSDSIGNFYAISFVSPQEGWIVIAGDYKIFTTTNGGMTWYYTFSPSKIYNMVASETNFVQPRIWLVGKSGVAIWGYWDAMQHTWVMSEALTPDTFDLMGISVTSNFSKIWIVGRNGKIFFSRDTGMTYLDDTTITSHCLYDVTFPYPEIGWIVGEQGTILCHSPREQGLISATIKILSPFQLIVRRTISQHSFIIKYSIPYSARISIQILDVNGRLVNTIEECWKSMGTYDKLWDGRNGENKRVVSGVYFLKFTIDNKYLVKKVIMLGGG